MRKPASQNSKELSPDKLKELKSTACDLLAKLRCELLNNQPFVGSIAMNMDIIPVRDFRCPTACTDGKSIFFDIDFLSSLKNDERLFVLAHEVWHNVMLHFLRTENRDRELFNIATDLEVNQILKKDGFMVLKSALMPDNQNVPTDLSAEEYYEILLKRQKKSGKPSNGGSTGGSGSSSDGSQNGNSSGNQEGKISGQFDKHIYKDDDVSKEQSNGVEDKYGKVGIDEDFDPKSSGEEMNKNIERVREAAVSAAQQIERTRGTLPGHIASIVNTLTTPEISWQEVLHQFVTRCFGDKREWNPPNRRHVWHDSYLQSRRGEKIKIGVGIDTSGSTNQDLPKFLTELQSLLQSFGRFELHLIQCDTRVNKYDFYDDENQFDVEHFKMEGGGGTILHPIFDYVEENQLDIDSLIIFTDGYVEEFKEDEARPYPVLWMISNDGDSSQIHFGDIVKFHSK